MKIPIIAIVGRPNVGKSTLFNRLTKSTSAIVDDQSGITRDRIYGEVDWNGKVFQIIDTGGYVPDTDDFFESAIREQITLAINEADAILFIVDGRTGLTPIDKEVASILRTSNKDYYLLVNKSDEPHLDPNSSEFYSLGLKNIFQVSALNGRGLGDLLDDLISNLDFTDDHEEDHTELRIALIGKPNVGKSSLLNSLVGFNRSIVTDIPGTTRDSIDTTIKYYGEKIILVDTAGLRKKAKVRENIEFYSTVRTLRALASCDVAIVLLDSQSGIENQDQKIIDEAVHRRKGLIIAVNKWDLVEKDSKTAKKFEDAIKTKLGSIDYAPIIFISALTKQRIFNLLELSKKIQSERKKKIDTSELNDYLQPLISENPPPATSTGKEVKIKYVTQVGDFYPIFLFFTNEPKKIPDSYRRYLERLIRTQYGFQGVSVTISFKQK